MSNTPTLDALQYGDLIAIGTGWSGGRAHKGIFVRRHRTPSGNAAIRYFWLQGENVSRSDLTAYSYDEEILEKRIWKITEDNLTPEEQKAYQVFLKANNPHRKELIHA